jgi:hypothetical protein
VHLEHFALSFAAAVSFAPVLSQAQSAVDDEAHVHACSIAVTSPSLPDEDDSPGQSTHLERSLVASHREGAA